MDHYVKNLEIRWSDLDPNFHLRHSVYYDFGAYCRISFLDQFGLTYSIMQKLHFGPVLFREEAVFRKEARMSDRLTIDIQLQKSRRDYSRWTIKHHITKNEKILSAVLTVDGAWIDTIERKLATPPHEVGDVFSAMPRSADFEWI